MDGCTRVTGCQPMAHSFCESSLLCQRYRTCGVSDFISNVISFVERMKDTLKVSGSQVSPTEIEDAIRAHPDGLISDVCVAGVSGGRTSDEKLPRAFIVLSDKGKKFGAEKTMQEASRWVEKNLSRYKWLKGGAEIIDAVSR